MNKCRLQKSGAIAKRVVLRVDKCMMKVMIYVNNECGS